MHLRRALSKIHSLYSTSRHGGCSVTCRVIYMCTAILIVNVKSCIIFSSFRHLFICSSSFFLFFIFLSLLHLVISLQSILIHMLRFVMCLSLRYFFIFISISSFSSLFHHYFIFLSCFNASIEFSLNLILTLYDLHQKIFGK